ncbi:DUF4913 domain-containing protein [Streptomyces sp. NPDC000405]|uniref:DUF4913 domain-containing protein n=1 Tax=Streptomyces sp. NPDC000405 TaxID=3161033 RepID=UPI00398D50C0
MSTADESVSVPTALAEDVEDLRATVHALAAQLEDTHRLAENLRDAVPATEDTAAETGGGKREKPPIPPLILRLDETTYDAELTALGVWVRYVLAECYLTEVSSSAPWCQQWYEHPQAVARLHALWLAWQELTTPETGGYTGPSSWHRDHLDPCIANLRSPSGPFAACMTNPDRPQHTVLQQPSTTLPPDPALEP